MIKNIKLKLLDNKEKWVWVDSEIVSETLLLRFFKALKSSLTIEEQKNNIMMLTFNKGRHNKAQEVLRYIHNNDKVEVFLCNYNKDTDNYARGKKIDVIKLK